MRAQALQSPPSQAEEWQSVQCKRMGAAPLRFIGRCLDWAEDACHGATQWLVLYERRKGGYTIAFSRFRAGEWQPDAVTVATLEEAIAQVEAQCRGLHPQGPSAIRSDAPLAADISDLIAARARFETQFDAYLTLVGHALGRWVDLWDAPARAADPDRRDGS